MDLSTFLVSITVVALLAIITRVFWAEILAIVLVGQILFYIAVASFGSALIWSIGINGDKEGFWTCWLFLAITYTVVTVVFYLIVSDVINLGIDFIRKIFKIK
jgi:hypothetical protein